MNITPSNTDNNSKHFPLIHGDNSSDLMPRSPNAPLAFTLVGQTINVDTTPIETLILAHEHESFHKGLAHLQSRQSLLIDFAKSGCLSVCDIQAINIAIKEKNVQLGHIVDQTLNTAMSHIEGSITSSVRRVIGNTTSFKRFESSIKDNMFYGLSCDTEACEYTSETGLMVFSTDFFIHLYTGLESLDDTPLSRLYATFLDRLTSYTGAWQTDVASLYHEIWSGYSPENERLLERFTKHLTETRSFDKARAALGEDKNALQGFFDCIEETLWLATADEHLENIDDDDLSTILSEIDQHVAIAKVAAKRHSLVQQESLTTMMNFVDRDEPKANALCELIEQVITFCHINEPVDSLRENFELVGEGIEYLSVILQEAADNDVAARQASQETYEHLMNAGEAEEVLKVDISTSDWKEGLCRFTVAVASLSSATLTMTNW